MRRAVTPPARFMNHDINNNTYIESMTNGFHSPEINSSINNNSSPNSRQRRMQNQAITRDDTIGLKKSKIVTKIMKTNFIQNCLFNL